MTSFFETVQKSVQEEDFCRVLCDIVLAMFRHSDSSDHKLAWLEKITQCNMTGSLQFVICAGIREAISTKLSVILGHMERNCYTRLYESAHHKPQFRVLLERSVLEVLSFNVQDQSSGFPVKFDEKTGRLNNKTKFVARFPFCHVVYGVMENSRSDSEKVMNSIEYLTQELAKVVPDLNCTEEDAKGYVYDFVCMTFPSWTVDETSNTEQDIGRERQANALWRLLLAGLTRAGVKEPRLSHPAEVHFSYWRSKTEIDYYFQLVEDVPECAEKVAEILSRPDTTLDPSTHAKVLEVAFEALDPASPANLSAEPSTAAGNSTLRRKQKWLSQIRNARTKVLGLLYLCEKHSLYGSLYDKWDQLSIFYSFVKDVSIPMKTEMGATLASLQILHLADTGLITHEYFAALLRALCEVKGQLQNNLMPQFAVAASQFCQYFIFEICFSERGVTKIPETLLKNFIVLVEGENPDFSMDGLQVDFEIFPEHQDSARVTLLRKLLNLPQAAEVIMKSMLVDVQKKQSTDTKSSVVYCKIKEQDFQNVEVDMVQLLSEFKQMPLDEVDKLNAKTLPAMLETTAKIRRLLTKHCHLICQVVDSDRYVEEEVVAQLKKMQPTVDAILNVNVDSEAVNPRLLRSKVSPLCLHNH